MYKIKYIIIIFSAFLCLLGFLGCSNTQSKEIPVNNEVRITFKNFELDNHEWILYSGRDVFSGIVHDPDCKTCKE